MPRYVRYRPRKTKEGAARTKIVRIRGGKKWIDSYPVGFGTLPEKMVYAALSLRAIPFYYLNDIRFQFPEIEFDKTYQADFVLPTLGVIIEVNGAYWHSKPGAVESDAFKYAVYQQKGYRVVVWWDFDIIANLPALIAADPQIRQFPLLSSAKSSELAPVSRKKTDTSQGIRTLNARRAARLLYKKPAATVKVRKTKHYGKYTPKR